MFIGETHARRLAALLIATSLAAPSAGVATERNAAEAAQQTGAAPRSAAPPSPAEHTTTEHAATEQRALAGESPDATEAAEPTPPDLLAHPERRTQFVLVSMDATPSARAPERDFFHRVQRRVARIEGADGRPATFTLFINTGFFQLDPSDDAPDAIDPARWHTHQGLLPRNRPPIPYPDTLTALEQRVANTRSLAALGVEIGAHTVRHANGGDWSAERWQRELDDHQRILDLHQLPAPSGIRAPFLATSPGYFDTLRDRGLRYDTSRVSDQRRWPRRQRDSAGEPSAVWQVAVPRVTLADGTRSVFFDLTLKRRGVSDAEYRRLALAEFEARYQGGRAPLLLSGHGNYVAPTVRVMREVCGLPDVRCGTFAELVDYLDQHPELAGAR